MEPVDQATSASLAAALKGNAHRGTCHGIVAGVSVLTALHAHGVQGFMNMAGFLAGYRIAFVAAGGGLLAVLLLSLLWPRAWFER